jgi:hypothetical protein
VTYGLFIPNTWAMLNDNLTLWSGVYAA